MLSKVSLYKLFIHHICTTSTTKRPRARFCPPLNEHLTKWCIVLFPISPFDFAIDASTILMSVPLLQIREGAKATVDFANMGYRYHDRSHQPCIDDWWWGEGRVTSQFLWDSRSRSAFAEKTVRTGLESFSGYEVTIGIRKGWDMLLDQTIIAKLNNILNQTGIHAPSIEKG